jgi:hypothetical protein
MKNLIYQYWIDGNSHGSGPTIEKCAQYGIEQMKQYADRIGAEYKFDRNPTLFNDICSEPAAFNSFMPVFNEQYHEYDAVLTLDTDIFPVDGLDVNIFDQDLAEMNICEEVHMPKLKSQVNTYNQQKQWSEEVERHCGITLPKNSEGFYKIYNGGLALYTQEGMIKGKERLKPIQPFIDHFRRKFNRKLFYRDQAYVHAMFCSNLLTTKELDVAWNTQIHWRPNTKGTKENRPVIDIRNKDTKFVHLQLSGSGSWDKQMIWEAVNLPVNEWSFRNGN